MKKYSLPALSLFFPAYNEEKNLKEVVEKSIAVLSKTAEKWEVIIIDDGSKDKTGRVARSLVEKYKNKVSLITHTPNRGYGAALKTGLYNAKYDWISFIDADGQFDFSEIVNFISKQKETGADIVIGYYRRRRVPLVRILGSKGWEMAVFLLFGLKVRDIDCGFKLINKKVIKEIEPLEAERGPFISSELLTKAKRAGFKIVEIPVTHYPRKFGAATGASPKVVMAGLKDLFSLWFKDKFKR